VLQPATNEPVAEVPAGPDAQHSRAGIWTPALLPLSAVLAIVLTLLAFALSPSGKLSATKADEGFIHPDAASALRRLDVGEIERMIAAGWSPAAPWDQEGNDALTMLLNHCEWNPAHDRRQMLLMARTLIEGGAPIDRRNVWGDTAYSIAKAPRYCGPDHPVTQMLEAMCYGGSMGPKDKCLATYELTAEQRSAQGLPPRG